MRRLSFQIALSAMLLLAGCGGKTRLPDDPGILFPATRQATEFNADDPRFPAKAGNEHLLLKSGDVLHIEVLEDDIVSGDYPVGPDGSIAIPLIGDLMVLGRLRSDVGTEIKEKLSPYYTEPQLTLSVKEYSARRAYILGAVTAPGAQELEPTDNLLTVLTKAGGPKERFNEREQSLGFPQMARVIRGDAIAFVNLKTVLEGTDSRSNIAIHPEDVIYVPIDGTQTISVLGEVGAPGMIGLGPGMDIMQAIALAGGFTQSADSTRIRVMRGWWSEEPELFMLNYHDLRKTDKRVTPLILEDQDIVFVETRGLAKHAYIVNSITPSLSFAGTAGVGGPAGP